MISSDDYDRLHCVKLANFLLIYTRVQQSACLNLTFKSSDSLNFDSLESMPIVKNNFAYYIFELSEYINRFLFQKFPTVSASTGANIFIIENSDIETISHLNSDHLEVFQAIAEEIELNNKNILISLLYSKVKSSGNRYAIDRAEVKHKNIFVHGWVENGGSKLLHIVSKSGLSYSFSKDFHFRERVDVSTLLKSASKETKTDLHGFSVVLNCINLSENDEFEIYTEEFSDIFHVGNFKCTGIGNEDESILFFWQCHSKFGIPSPSFISQIVKPLLSTEIQNYQFKEYKICQSNKTSMISVIVPIYGDWTFIRSLIAMQQILPDYCEWIFVCDDPRLRIELLEFLSNRSSQLTATTRLIVNYKNYGYSAANNIGFLVSVSSTILFMNSDIWINNACGLIMAHKALEESKFDMIGFRLLFEDGSLQHDGLTFIKNKKIHNLYFAEHDGKGLPPNASQQTIDPITAVTGALMLVRRDRYEQTGGFDPCYVRGDFEDADLCLKFYANKFKVGIVRENYSYHLERQSIRTIGNDGLRQAITMLNCVEFNQRWGVTLDSLDESDVGK